MSDSYKAYWFIGLLECVNDEGLTEIPIRKICSRMLANAWYPVHYFKLSFGVQDLISRHNILIREILDLKANISKSKLIQILETTENTQVIDLIMHFRRQVTFRFLSPWNAYRKDSQVECDSQHFLNGTPYATFRRNDTIQLNPDWIEYLRTKYGVLKGYAYHQLTLYVQAKKSWVPNVIGKLIKLASRESLHEQRKYWKFVLNKSGQLNCIYSHKILNGNNFAVEHFIP